MELTEWQNGKIFDCPICGNEELEIERILGAFDPRTAVVSRCIKCNQKIQVAEGSLGGTGHTWVSQWKLLEPLSRVLYEANDINSEALSSDLIAVNDELLDYLAKHPKMLYGITPRKFEELVAELLQRTGYDVELTPYSKDGGWDITAIWKGEVGQVLTIVECKRYKPERPIGVNHVRNLIGVRGIERASSAMIATTSSFTAEAKKLQRRYRWQLNLHDYDSLVEWMRKYSTQPD